MISTLVAENFLCKGCEAHLAYILDTNFNESAIRNIHIMSDYLDVFSEELPRLHLEREDEFYIDLLLRVSPVSITPYHMERKELVELKAH